MTKQLINSRVAVNDKSNVFSFHFKGKKNKAGVGVIKFNVKSDCDYGTTYNSKWLLTSETTWEGGAPETKEEWSGEDTIEVLIPVELEGYYQGTLESQSRTNRKSGEVQTKWYVINDSSF